MEAPDWIVALLAGAGLTARDAEPLTGGVSSDVWRVWPTSGIPVVAKRALARLRVQAEWTAPLSRSTSEVRYLTRVGELVPGFVPRVVIASESLHAFAMADLGALPTWKDDLAAGRIDTAVGAELGTRLARVHSTTAQDPTVPTEFVNDELFEALRLEPYLRYTATRHPEHAPVLLALAEETAGTHVALVHGDVSPKNIMVTGEGPVLTDAECAWFGDPAFDIAFLLNHLVLKSVWKPAHAGALRRTRRAAIDAYLGAVTCDADAVSARAARLLPALLLARVDGRSPVEYLDTVHRDSVRTMASALLSAPAEDLDRLEELIPT